MGPESGFVRHAEFDYFGRRHHGQCWRAMKAACGVVVKTIKHIILASRIQGDPWEPVRDLVLATSMLNPKLRKGVSRSAQFFAGQSGNHGGNET